MHRDDSNAPTPADRAAELTRLVRAQVDTCRELLELTLRCQASLRDRDANRVTAALRDRRPVLRQLQQLETTISPLRRGQRPPCPYLEDALGSLRAITDQLAKEEATNRHLAGAALAKMRTGLLRLQRGGRTLRSYAGKSEIRPRFTDRIG